jgi:hypothetical protein
MPWRIEREGPSLRVEIACPIDDWAALFAQIERRLREEQGVFVIEMPERLPGASRLDADILVVLRRMLDHKPGITVR